MIVRNGSARAELDGGETEKVGGGEGCKDRVKLVGEGV